MSTQSLSAVQSGGYTYLYDESTGKAYKLDSKEAASIFEGSGSFTVGDDTSFTSSSADYACTDGKDDGKIGADEACVSAFKGIAKMVVSPITEALKGNFVPAAVAGAGALAIGLLGPAGVIGASVVGLVGGGVQLYNGITKANSAKTDGEAKQAFEEIGQGGFATVTSLLGLKAGTKQIKAMNKTGKMAEAQGADKVKAYFEDLKANKTAAKAAKQEKKGGTNGADDNPTEPPSGDDGVQPKPADSTGVSADDYYEQATEDFINSIPDNDNIVNPDYDAILEQNIKKTGGTAAPEPVIDDIFEIDSGKAGGSSTTAVPKTTPKAEPTTLETAKAALENATAKVNDINGQIYEANWSEADTSVLEIRLDAAKEAQLNAQKLYDSLLAETTKVETPKAAPVQPKAGTPNSSGGQQSTVKILANGSRALLGRGAEAVRDGFIGLANRILNGEH